MSTSIQYRLQIVGTVEEIQGENVVRIRLADGSIASWTLGLCMLKESVVDTLSVHSEDRSMRLQLERAVRESTGTIRVENGPSTVTVSLSTTELERWVYFFLSYLRDGYGAVDHMDVDIDGPDRMTLIVYVPAAAVPLSRDEALRKLKLR